STLYNEAEFLLRTELRETRNYMLILRSIAGGYRTVGEINSYTNMDKSMVSKYIDILLSLELISYEIPFGETEKFRKRLYYINDNYLKFWFRYILPNRTGIENSNYLEVARKIENDFSQFAGEQFEYLMRELIMDGILGRSFTTVSRWWGKVGNNTGKNIEEIDIVAYSDTRDEILFCECKWTNKKVSYKIIEELIRKSKWLLNKYNNSKVSYAVFSKSGFDFNTDTLEKNIIAMDLKGIENALYK
ncbi:ATP-binding protein, partial [Ferroplasma acidiphilum]